MPIFGLIVILFAGNRICSNRMTLTYLACILMLRFAAWLQEHGVADRRTIEGMQAKAAQEVDDATEYAESAAAPAPESALRHVFVEEEP